VTTSPSSGRALRWTALGFVAGFLVHLYDHLRLGMSHTPVMVSLAGVLATVIGALAVVAVYADHPRAPLAATVAGLASAAGFAAVHFLPSWGPLSEPLHGHSDTPSWMSVTLATVTSAAFGVAGLLALRRTRVPATVGQ
jgi:hypothetical protein